MKMRDALEVVLETRRRVESAKVVRRGVTSLHADESAVGIVDCAVD